MSESLIDRLRAMRKRRPLIVGHRGSAWSYPENTIPAFGGGIRACAQMIELDYRSTSDHVLVCAHDDDLNRCVTDDQPEAIGLCVSGMSYKRTQEFDVGKYKDESFTDCRMPTLREALSVIHPEAVPVLERKSGTPEQTVSLLREMGLVKDVIVASFDWHFLDLIHRIEPRITIGAVAVGPLDDRKLNKMKSIGASVVHWGHQDITQATIDRLHDADLFTVVWTLNFEMQFAGACAMNVDAITTDRPRLLNEWFDARDK